MGISLFGKAHMKEETGTNQQIRLNKPDPDYYIRKEEQTHKIVWNTMYFGTEEISTIIEKLKAKNGHIWERARVNYLAGEIGAQFCYGYPTEMIDSIIKYLIRELGGKTEYVRCAGKDRPFEYSKVTQPNVATVAALTALEKISANKELYINYLAAYDIVPELKKAHKTAAPELRPQIRQTIINIQRICCENKKE